MRSGHHAVMWWLIREFHNTICINQGERVNESAPHIIKEPGLYEFGSSTPEFLIWNNESFDIDLFHRLPFQSTHFIPIIVIRELRNFLSSILHYRKAAGQDEKLTHQITTHQITLYKKMLHEYFNPNTVFQFVLFDKWVKNADYRKNIAERIGIHLHHDDTSFKPSQGFGAVSSFKNSKVLERKDSIVYPEINDAILRDRELVDLADKVFAES